MVPRRTSPFLSLLLRQSQPHLPSPLSLARRYASLPSPPGRRLTSLNSLSKYAPNRSSSSPSPGLPIAQPVLQDLPPVKHEDAVTVPVEELVPVVSFERSGDREEKRPGDERFEVEGVKVPERPLKPGEEDCCMSGCVHCVYDLYAAAVLDYQAALASAHAALLVSNKPKAEWPAVILDRDKRGLGPHVEVVLEEDPAAKAFREMEERLKKKSG